MDDNKYAQVGPHRVDIGEVVRDPRGIEDIVKEILEKDFVESRYAQFGAHLNILPDAADIADWDHTLLSRYEPLYMLSAHICRDCTSGPCNLNSASGVCGLEGDVLKAKLSLRKACRGCLVQMITSRDIVNYSLKIFGQDHPCSMGELLTMSDHCPPIGTLSGIHVKSLNDLDRVLAYAESQLSKLFQASFTGTGTVNDFESMVMHAGSVLLLAMGVAEMAKVSCFGFVSAANHQIDQLDNFPPATSAVGWAAIEKDKPVVAFVGDSFLPAWTAIQHMRENEQVEAIEVCGVGPAADDIIRFYDKGRVIGPMTRAARAIRNGVFNVVVAGPGCIPQDLFTESERANSKFIWTGPNGVSKLKDRTDDSVDKMVADLLKGESGIWIRDVEKAGQVAVRLAGSLGPNKSVFALDDQDAARLASKCSEKCDLCFYACPNSLQVPKAVRGIAGGDWATMAGLEKGCYFCGKCEEACPENVQVRDLVVAAERKKAEQDNSVMRAGRGPLPLTEILQSAFSMVWGNAPGIVVLAGCGDADRDEIGWLAHELTRRNCIVFLAGCGAAEIARNYQDKKGKHIFELYTSSIEPRSLINCGGCAAISLANNMYMYARAAGGIPLYGGIPEVGEGSLYTTFSLLLWGSLPERMHAVAAGYARLGVRVVMGPNSGWNWGRYLPGNRYDRSKWFVYHGDDGRKRETEPIPEHLIIPVETKEEALTMIPRTFFSTSEMREGRAARLDFFFELYRLFYGELPEDWQLFIRSHLDIPTRHRIRLIKLLDEEFGWEGAGIKLNKARNRDGKLLTLSEFNTSYGMELGRYHCRLERLLPKHLRKKDG